MTLRSLPALFALACAGAPADPPAPEPVPATEPAPAPAPPNTLVLATDAGEVTVAPLYHGTVVIRHGDTTVWIDPWSKAPLPSAPDADVVLITDIHPDHLDPDAVAKVATDATVFVAPKAVADALGRPVQHVLANGETAEVAGFSITATPMYNLVRGPEAGKLFHEKGRGNGYLLRVGGKTLYVAGDTECVDEIEALTGIDLALMPMNLPYTMPPEEAAECVKAFKPARVTPYHYAGSDLAVFTAALAGTGIEVTLVDAYPGGLPF